MRVVLTDGLLKHRKGFAMKQAALLILLAIGSLVFQAGCQTSACCCCPDDHSLQSEPTAIRVSDTAIRVSDMETPLVPPPPMVDPVE